MLVEIVRCPACLSECKMSFQVADAETTEWVFCVCGSLFQPDKIDKAHFDEDYLKKYVDYKALPERADYFMRLYLPLVRELTYGRRFLDVGFGFEYHMKSLTADGWIVDGIDLVPNDWITGDFEKHEFKNMQYDFVHMGRVLEAFHNPVKAIVKAKELLSPGGVLAIVTPDAELVYTGGMFAFGNWNPKDKGIIFSETQLKKTLETLGFRVILSRKDTERRGIGWNHMHVIAQKVT